MQQISNHGALPKQAILSVIHFERGRGAESAEACRQHIRLRRNSKYLFLAFIVQTECSRYVQGQACGPGHNTKLVPMLTSQEMSQCFGYKQTQIEFGHDSSAPRSRT